MTDVIDWIQFHEELLPGLVLLSAITFPVSLLVLPEDLLQEYLGLFKLEDKLETLKQWYGTANRAR